MIVRRRTRTLASPKHFSIHPILFILALFLVYGIVGRMDYEDALDRQRMADTETQTFRRVIVSTPAIADCQHHSRIDTPTQNHQGDPS